MPRQARSNMRLTLSCPLILSLTLLAGCNRSLPHGQFGPYDLKNAHLLLSPTESLVVYRVKYWTFRDGSAPALQLEYEPPFAVTDTAAVRREAVRLWPLFGPYVKGMGLSAGIITATNFHLSGVWPYVWTSNQKSFGVVIEEGAPNHWHFRYDTMDLPPIDTSGATAIVDPQGKPVPHHQPAPPDAP